MAAMILLLLLLLFEMMMKILSRRFRLNRLVSRACLKFKKNNAPATNGSFWGISESL
jgi:hypothetical protein